MRIHYHFPSIARRERKILEYLLLEEMDRQQWYAVVFSIDGEKEGFVCIQ